MNYYAPGIRTKLIAIFILIKVLPLIALAWFAWNEIGKLTDVVEKRSARMIVGTHDVVTGVGELSTQNSIQALDVKSREAIERLTTDTAQAVAAFLYDRDRDIMLAANLPVEETQYRQFLASRSRLVRLHHPWVMDDRGERWVPGEATDVHDNRIITAQNEDNRRDFHYRPPDRDGISDIRPLYLEMTFIDLSGNEIIKVGISERLPLTRGNVADPRNTYCRAETYFEVLQKLQPGEIYVSDVIGPYIGGHMIGTYSRVKAEKRGILFAPEQSGYAGKENPVGIRFQGLVRWGMPVLENGRISGYVTLALDHTHIMEFTDHLVPTAERYSDISDAGSGNYAFMWDHKGRNISHPRDYFIVGYDSRTGEQVVPWLDEEMHRLWRKSNASMMEFRARAPKFKAQALAKRPSAALTRNGLLGLDCRYLNFAPQCTGWHNLTQDGGSGSFLIFWSGLWKLTTAAAIPYHTGNYGNHPRGFGFVTIGANVDEFHRSAVETAETIRGIEGDFTQKLEVEKDAHQVLMRSSLQKAFRHLSFYTVLMIVVVIVIAIFMAAMLTTRITTVVRGIRRFQQGDRSYRLKQQSADEMGQLALAYNEMADDVQTYIGDMEASKTELEDVNVRLEEEVAQRRRVQDELSGHRDNLEIVVKGRTRELENEIVERKRIEKIQIESEARLREQSNTLLRLAGHEALYGGDLDFSLKTIVPPAVATLRPDRCSVWLMDGHHANMVCREMFTSGTGSHIGKGLMNLADYPIYDAALRSGRTIVATDAPGDERLLELVETYLRPGNIRALLTATIFEGGEMQGMVNFVETHDKRRWHLDEINFANSIADLIGLAMGAAKRKQAIQEKDLLETRLRRAEKMEAIGTLAGGVAHDLNNILSGIVSYPELLLLQLPDDSKLREPIKTIFNSGQRAATVVQDLLTLARRGLTITEVVNLNRIVEDYLQSPEHVKIRTDHPHVRLETRLEAGLLNVTGSPVHLTKTLMNLVANAAEAILEAGQIAISTENRYIDRPFKGYDVVNEGDYVALTVADTGAGILPEDINHIFEPFYTKKKMGRSGTGLGMAVVWGTVKDHRGYIDFDSREGEGSRFTLYFPVTRKSVADVRQMAMETFMGSDETILVVDDAKEQREIASAILSALGYRVSTVSSGEAAVDHIKENRVDLLVLDMIMEPGIDGLDTYKQVLQRHPHQKAIIASGFSENDRIREVLRMGAASYLKKPYTIEKIGTAVRSALGA